MNNLTRFSILIICSAVCALGLILTAGQVSNLEIAGSAFCWNNELSDGFQLASTDLHKFSFAQLEEIVRAQAATKYPNARIEFGSVKVEHGMLIMPVVFFGPNQQTQAFLYGFVPHNNTWKIVSTHRLWFVPPSQIARGLRV